VEPLGFDISEKAVRRAGLDYWKHIDLNTHRSFAEFEKSLPASARCWYFTKFAQKSIFAAQFAIGDFLIFGKETTGLPQKVHKSVGAERLLRIPMPNATVVRSLNLAACVHIAVYEGIRQIEHSAQLP
jgi:tRNA (cytidine/uridine-2'-O-)-methyltransferase